MSPTDATHAAAHVATHEAASVVAHAALPASRTPHAMAPALTAALEVVDARYRAALAAIPPAARDTRPASGGWTAHMILEHVTLANEQYLAAMRAPATRLEASATSDVSWRATPGGWLLATSLTWRVPLKAPRGIVPGPAPRAQVLDALVHTHDDVRQLLTRVQARDWRAARLRSPFARWLSLNLGDAFVILLRHGERHAAQLERLAAWHADAR